MKFLPGMRFFPAILPARRLEAATQHQRTRDAMATPRSRLKIWQAGQVIHDTLEICKRMHRG
eukprot:155762-Pleurochrysis_carterae.AAC.1